MPAAKSPKSPKRSKKKAVAGALRAGTIFAPARCNRMLRQGRYSERMGASAGAFMAGALQYLVEEICELSGDVCESHKRKTIAPQHINLALRSDHELCKLIHHTTIAQGGMLPNIHEFLQPEKKKKGKETDASQPV